MAGGGGGGAYIITIRKPVASGEHLEGVLYFMSPLP